jgi:hypothetical protein
MHQITHWPLDMEIHSGCILQGSSPAKYTFENSIPPFDKLIMMMMMMLKV